MSCCQCQYRNGNGRTGHINGGTQRNGNGKGIRIQSQPFAERQVHRNISCGASGEERIDTAFPKSCENQGIRIFTNLGKNNKRVHDKGYEEIGSDEDAKELYIPQKSSDTGGTYGISNEAHDAKRCEVDDPGHHFRNACGNIIEAGLGSITGTGLECNPQNDCPAKDADVVSVHQCSHRVIHDAQNQVMEHLDNAAWRCQLRIRCHLKSQVRRKQEGHGHAYDGCKECTNHIEFNNRLHAAAGTFFSLGHGIHDQEEDQNRRNAFQSFNKKIPEDLDHRNGWREKYGNADTDDKSHRNLFDKGYLGQDILNRTKHDNTPPPLK